MANEDVFKRFQMFTEYFVRRFEIKFLVIRMVLDGEVNKPGFFAQLFVGKIGDKISGFSSSHVGSLLTGIPRMISGNVLSFLSGEASKLSEKKLGDHYRKKNANLADRVHSYFREKEKFRRDLVMACLDLFQSFEMQFMRVTTKDDEYWRAMSYLAEDAVNRAIKHMRKDQSVLIAEVAKAAVLGTSKIQLTISKPKSGFEVIDGTNGNKWHTGSMYEKVGIITEDEPHVYYEKKGDMIDLYGCRRLLKCEDWNDLKKKYEYQEVDIKKSAQFKSTFSHIYRYTSTKELETQSENILEKINREDPNLDAKRIIEMLKKETESIRKQLEAQLSQSNGSQSQEESKVLIKRLEQLYINVCLTEIKQGFKETKHQEEKILKGINDVKESFESAEAERTRQHEEIRDQILTLVKNEEIWFDVSPPIKTFAGRENELIDLHETLENDGMAVISQSVVSQHGGVGKTELARKYIDEYRQVYEKTIIWINAESCITLSESFLRLASKLGITSKNPEGEKKNVEKIVEVIFLRFIQRGIFVFDNALSFEDLETFLPIETGSGKNPRILITSRKKKWRNVKVIRLNVFTEQESTKFIEGTLKINNSEQEQDVIKLADTLKNFPLALQQAIAYIRERDQELRNMGSSFSIKDYLKKYEAKMSPANTYNTYAAIVLKTLKVTLDHIKEKENGDKVMEIINIMAYLPPECTSEDILFDLIKDKKQVKLVIKLLQQYSIVRVTKKENLEMFSVHRLVQQMVRLRFKEREMEVLKIVLKLLADKGKSKNPSVQNNFNSYDKLIYELTNLSDDTIVELCDSVQLEKGYLFGDLVLKFLSAKLEYDHQHILTTRENTAAALSKQGKHEEAVKELEEVYSIRLKTQGTNMDTLSTLNELALALDNQGKYDEALEKYKELYKKLVDADPNVFTVLENEAAVLIKQGKYEEALQEYNTDFQTKEKRTRILEAAHSVNLENEFESKEKISKTFEAAHLAALNGKAVALDNLGKDDDALKIYQKVFERRENILGPAHSDTLTTLNNIAIILQKKGEYGMALEKYKKAKDQLESNHSDYLNIEHNIASVIEAKGEKEEALKRYKKVYGKKKEKLGPNHPDTLTTLNSIAKIHHDKEEYRQAFEKFQEVYDGRTKALQKDHPHTLFTLLSMAVVLSKQNKYNEALRHYEEACEKLKYKLGEGNLDVLLIHSYKADALKMLGRHDEARQIYTWLHIKRREILGPDDPSTLSSKRDIELCERLTK